MSADGTECPDAPDGFDETLELRFRSTTKLALDELGPQNDISTSTLRALVFDQGRPDAAHRLHVVIDSGARPR